MNLRLKLRREARRTDLESARSRERWMLSAMADGMRLPTPPLPPEERHQRARRCGQRRRVRALNVPPDGPAGQLPRRRGDHHPRPAGVTSQRSPAGHPNS